MKISKELKYYLYMAILIPISMKSDPSFENICIGVRIFWYERVNIVKPMSVVLT